MSQLCPVCGNMNEAPAGSCAFCGFKFKEATMSFKPIRTGADAVCTPAAQACTKSTLRVVRGPETRIAFTLPRETVTVGRSPKCNLFLNDMTVSRQHARITWERGCYRIYDTNSYNGLWINNVSKSEAVLHHGDLIQIGAFSLVFEQE